ncbi:hypothetical protein JD969_12780 [Planctomycetota bacterium]|nr:hypothetical protein JD969_12780 [Planctomycetota bacterium]
MSEQQIEVIEKQSESSGKGQGKKRKKVKRLVIGTVGLVIVGAGLSYGLWSYGLSSVLDGHYSKIRAAGYPVTVEELNAQYAEPEGRNAAELYQTIFDAMEKTNQKIEAHGVMEMFLPVMGFAIAEWEDVPDAMLNNVRKYLKIQGFATAGLIGATSIDGARWPFTYGDQMAMLNEGHMEHLGDVRRWGKVLALRHWLMIEEGNADEAIRTLEGMKRLTESVSKEPVLIAQLVAIGMTARIDKDIEWGLNAHIYDDAQLQKLHALIEELKKGVDAKAVAEAFANERVMLIHSMTEGFASKLPQAKADVAFGLKLYGEMIEELEKGVMDLQGIEKGWRRVPTKYTVSGTAAPALVSAAKTFNQMQVKLELTTIAIAAERYWLAKGKYPEQLSELVPKYLDEVPKDGFSLAHDELKYRVHENGFVVYSVWENGSDELGFSAHEVLGDYKAMVLDDGVYVTAKDAEFRGIFKAFWPEETKRYLAFLKKRQDGYMNRVAMDELHQEDEEDKTSE